MHITDNTIHVAVDATEIGTHHTTNIVRGFLWVLPFPPLLHQLMVQPMK